jgi:hypothetical protein
MKKCTCLSSLNFQKELMNLLIERNQLIVWNLPAGISKKDTAFIPITSIIITKPLRVTFLRFLKFNLNSFFLCKGRHFRREYFFRPSWSPKEPYKERHIERGKTHLCPNLRLASARRGFSALLPSGRKDFSQNLGQRIYWKKKLKLWLKWCLKMLKIGFLMKFFDTGPGRSKWWTHLLPLSELFNRLILVF